MFLTFMFLLSNTLYNQVHTHGYLANPPARSSAWRFDNSFPTYFNDNQMFCGGFATQWFKNDGKCGICGEDWSVTMRLFEKDGSMYSGKVVRTYASGSLIDVNVVLTASHMGWFEFRLCKIDDQVSDATQECLDKIVLKDANGNSRFSFNQRTFKLRLPYDLTCKHCVFQWKYNTGNSWGTDPLTGVSGLGLGKQEQFYGCADVAIFESTGNSSTTTTGTSVSSTTTQTSVYTSSTSSTARSISSSISSSSSSSNSGSQFCVNKTNGFYPHLDSDCRKFIQCTSSLMFMFDCAPGTKFDRTCSCCNHENLVKCV